MPQQLWDMSWPRNKNDISDIDSSDFFPDPDTGLGQIIASVKTENRENSIKLIRIRPENSYLFVLMKMLATTQMSSRASASLKRSIR